LQTGLGRNFGVSLSVCAEQKAIADCMTTFQYQSSIAENLPNRLFEVGLYMMWSITSPNTTPPCWRYT